MADVTCDACGHRNEAGARFCSSCGVQLAEDPDRTTISYTPAEGGASGPASDEPVSVDLGDVAPGTGVLLVTRGQKAGTRIVLDQDTTTAGRHPDSDIFLDDVTVSRRHVEIVRDGDAYQVSDVGSLNGTYLNRERVESAALADGDVLQVGKYKLLFVTAEAS